MTDVELNGPWMSLDGPWIDYYLRRFTRHGVKQGHHEEDTVFAGGGLRIKSYAPP